MLGRGLYKLSEVARYTGLPASTVRSWFKQRPDGAGRGPLFEADHQSIGGDCAVSFLNLIDAHVAGFFRAEGVGSVIIRRAYEVLRRDLNTPHPFAHAELCTDGRRIIRHTADTVGDAQLTDVISKQHWFSQMRDQLRRFDYDQLTKLAARWRIAEGIVIDPTISFGKPVVDSTGITTFVLANQYEANQRNAGLVADLFGVSEQDILNAVNFEAQFGARRAA